jgi:hypothetical protein
MINSGVDYDSHFPAGYEERAHLGGCGRCGSRHVRALNTGGPPSGDYVIGLAGFPGFAELKRSLRERPELRSLGVDPVRPGRKRTGTPAATRRHASAHP